MSRRSIASFGRKNAPQNEEVLPSLGHTTNKFYPPPLSHEETPYNENDAAARFGISKYHSLSIARDLLKTDPNSWRTVFCMRRQINGNTQILHSLRLQRAFYGGLMTCGSVWACPVCSVKIMARRAELIKQAVDCFDGTIVMITYSLQHCLSDRLEMLLDDLKDAISYTRSGSAHKRFKERFKVKGFVRSFEHRFNPKTGHHPHNHELLFLDMPPEEVDCAAIKAAVLKRYGKRLSAKGYLVNEHTIDVRMSKADSKSTVDDYLTKSAIELELTAGNFKDGKVEGSLSSFQLLSAFEQTGDLIYADAFKEYCNATKGKRQLVWAYGFLDSLGLRDKSDEELCAEQEEKASLLAMLDRQEWQIVLSKKLRGELLNIAHSGDRGLLLDWLEDKEIIVSAEKQARKVDRINAREAAHLAAPVEDISYIIDQLTEWRSVPMSFNEYLAHIISSAPP